ncbi:MAG: YheC/YheD family protein [Turicibacter sanguinis]
MSYQNIRSVTDPTKQVFDELGIDIGIDSRNYIWIYEVNWRPGFIYPTENEDSVIAKI